MPSNSTHRDASNGGIDISGKCNFDYFLTTHRFRLLDLLIENYIFIEKLLFSLDTERMDIIFESVASKRFGWTKYQPIRMLYRDFSSKSVFSQGWSGSKSKQASFWWLVGNNLVTIINAQPLDCNCKVSAHRLSGPTVSDGTFL